jgi:enoyl-CoA hydratase/carnithine racemase
MIEEMAQAFAAANADDDVRIIILAAEGDRFSSGHDIGTPEEKDDLVVPRDRLESETMALALEIAENDPFTLRMLKWATNAAQDAMGFSHSIRNAHSHYMVQGLDGFTRTSSTARAFRR